MSARRQAGIVLQAGPAIKSSLVSRSAGEGKALSRSLRVCERVQMLTRSGAGGVTSTSTALSARECVQMSTRSDATNAQYLDLLATEDIVLQILLATTTKAELTAAGCRDLARDPPVEIMKEQRRLAAAGLCASLYPVWRAHAAQLQPLLQPHIPHSWPAVEAAMEAGKQAFAGGAFLAALAQWRLAVVGVQSLLDPTAGCGGAVLAAEALADRCGAMLNLPVWFSLSLLGDQW